MIGNWVRIQYGQHDISVFGVYRGLTSDGHFELMPHLTFESLPTDTPDLHGPYVLVDRQSRIANAGPINVSGVQEEYVEKLLGCPIFIEPSHPIIDLSDVNFA